MPASAFFAVCTVFNTFRWEYHSRRRLGKANRRSKALKITECAEGHYRTRGVRGGRRHHVREDCYSWLDSHLERLAGKEARCEYYARLAGLKS